MIVKENQEIFKKIKQLSNAKKFQIIQLTQEEALDISTLSKAIKIAFNKCSNYCTQLEKNNLITKEKIGKHTIVKSNIKINNNSIEFNQ